jgi:predicted ATP-dependent endonuclease of OLD family
MTKPQHTGIKLRHLKVQNFKALDFFEIEFPPPRMTVDSDILVMGSKNGWGKTSVLEACVLLFLAAAIGEESFSLANRYLSTDLYDLLIRAGAKQAIIEGTFEIGNAPINVTLSIDKQGNINIEKTKENIEFFSTSVGKTRAQSHRMEIERFWSALSGLSFEPLILPPLMYFHSYRKVQEGNLELGMLVEKKRSPHITPTSRFKLEILHSMMSEANLFDNIDETTAKNVLAKLNQLIKLYAGCRIDKLRPASDSTIEFRIVPIDGGKSFTFDGLSSGQKEIISTLFLIWRYSNNIPSIILIDEPELHLNVEWHSGFIKQLYKLAPHSQYIITTHSEDVFSSVDQDRRVLLMKE